MVTKTETLERKFNAWLEERIFDYESILPLTANHQRMLEEKARTLRAVKSNFERLANELD